MAGAWKAPHWLSPAFLGALAIAFGLASAGLLFLSNATSALGERRTRRLLAILGTTNVVVAIGALGWVLMADGFGETMLSVAIALAIGVTGLGGMQVITART